MRQRATKKNTKIQKARKKHGIDEQIVRRFIKAIFDAYNAATKARAFTAASQKKLVSDVNKIITAAKQVKSDSLQHAISYWWDSSHRHDELSGKIAEKIDNMKRMKDLDRKFEGVSHSQNSRRFIKEIQEAFESLADKSVVSKTHALVYGGSPAKQSDVRTAKRMLAQHRGRGRVRGGSGIFVKPQRRGRKHRPTPGLRDYKNMSVAQLKAVYRRNNIRGFSGRKKANLLQFVISKMR